MVGNKFVFGHKYLSRPKPKIVEIKAKKTKLCRLLFVSRLSEARRRDFLGLDDL